MKKLSSHPVGMTELKNAIECAETHDPLGIVTMRMDEAKKLQRDIDEMRELLRVAAYPKRGTEEWLMDINIFADLVMSVFDREDLCDD